MILCMLEVVEVIICDVGYGRWGFCMVADSHPSVSGYPRLRQHKKKKKKKKLKNFVPKGFLANRSPAVCVSCNIYPSGWGIFPKIAIFFAYCNNEIFQEKEDEPKRTATENNRRRPP